MTQKPDGKISIPASFFTAKELSGFKEKANSITLRDYFAGQALAGLMADDAIEASPEKIALACYTMADAMIAERTKP